MNPLLYTQTLPQYTQLKVEHILPAISTVLTENLAQIKLLTDQISHPTWQNFIEPLEAIDNRLERVWGPIGHLDAVKNTDDWHDAYNQAREKMIDYQTQLGQNKSLFSQFKKIESSPDYQTFSLAQKKVIENALRNFKLSGIDLPEAKQKTYKTISQQLSQLSSQFANNVLKSTQAWQKLIADESELAGLSVAAKGMLKQLAEQKDLPGWRITLDAPSYLAVMQHADDRALRETVYKAFAVRASDQADNTEFDNSDLMLQILKLRHEKALLLGFKNYAELSLATKMADSTQQVIDFLEDLSQKSKPQAEQELSDLKDFAKNQLQLDDLQPWDIAYASEKLKDSTLSLSEETLKPYFPMSKVLKGLFKITSTLYNIEIKEKTGIEVWDDAVRFFELFETGSDRPLAAFYLDPYARENKRGGAWMGTVVSRWQHDGSLQIPVANLVCNFTPAVGDEPACLTHNEVTTLFHEFGHGLHHMLTQMEHFDVSGISGVPWDAVELPSQFNENFCWEKQSLDLMTQHIKTNENLPDDLLNSLKQSRHFQSAMTMVRQLEFGLFDFTLHTHYNSESPQPILEVVEEVRNQVAVVHPPKYHRFPHSFSHIFAGGYAAGYFSYKWAEVLSADAFSLFEETGILNPETGAKFKNTILAAGGSVHPMTLFKAFRGREPKIEPLLSHSGIKA